MDWLFKTKIFTCAETLTLICVYTAIVLNFWWDVLIFSVLTAWLIWKRHAS